MWIKVNTIRIDCEPHPRKKDLNIALIRRVTNPDSNFYTIKTKHFTIKYTSTSNLQIFCKKEIKSKNIKRLKAIIKNIQQTFNRVKKTPIIYRSITVKNIQASGQLSYKCNLRLLKSSTLPDKCTLNAQVVDEPMVEVTEIISSHRYIQLERGTRNLIRFHQSGSFTIVSTSIEEYIELVKILGIVEEEICIY